MNAESIRNRKVCTQCFQKKCGKRRGGILTDIPESKNRLSISYAKAIVETREVGGNNAWKVLFWRSVVNLPRMAPEVRKMDLYKGLILDWRIGTFFFGKKRMSSDLFQIMPGCSRKGWPFWLKLEQLILKLSRWSLHIWGFLFHSPQNA